METKHTFVVLPFTSDVLSDPSSLLPAIYHSALHSTQSCTVIFSSPSPETQLYPQLREHPRRHWAEFQTFLGKVYAVLAAGQWRAERVLMDVEVHFEGEEGDWSDKLLYASESDKRLIILEGKWSPYLPRGIVSSADVCM
jgi:pantetheine-phosphate adenylyltransferase